jgi:hypothetical protein
VASIGLFYALLKRLGKFFQLFTICSATLLQNVTAPFHLHRAITLKIV